MSDDDDKTDDDYNGYGNDVHGLDDLLGAYALDAVDDDERRRVESYLAINPRAAAEVREHREVATMLAFNGMDAPEGLWSRIEEEIGSTTLAPEPGPELAKVMAFPPPTSETSSTRRGRNWAAATPWALGVAAASLLLVAVMGVVSLRTDNAGDPIESAYNSALDDRDSVTAELVADGSSATARGVIDEDGHGYLLATDLPTLPAEQTYQLWGVLGDSGDVVSIGILGPNPELETFTIEGRVDALAITIEQAPGVISNGNPDGAYVGELT
jgi:anti-sigma-K factor RskA